MVGARSHRSAHAEYPAEAMTVDLAELITQIHPCNSAAANRLDEFQRSILKGLVKWDVAVNFYVKTYQLCVTARKDVRKKKTSTDGMRPTSRTSFVQYEFHKKMQSPEGPPVATRRKQTAHIGVPVLRSP